MTRALLLIDLQNDFCPGGALAVRDGDQVIEVANALAALFPLVVATQDWHPADHQSFAVHHAGRAPGEVIDLHGLPQVLWPVHCVQGSPGADFHPALRGDRLTCVFVKGTAADVDSYSGFFDNGRRHATGLGAYLRAQGVTALTVMGLATDYCVKFTVLDACAEGFTVEVVTDGCRAVELAPGDAAGAWAAMSAAGATLITAATVHARESV